MAITIVLQAELDKVVPTGPDKGEKNRAKRQALPANLPRRDIHHDPENTTCACGCALKRIGQDVAEKLDYVPNVFTVERHVRGKWVCAKCETLVQAPVAPHIIDKGLPTTGLLAQVLVASLAQVERQLRIDRSTVRRLVERCLMPHSDGRIHGFRALIPHARAKHYERTLPVRTLPQLLRERLHQLQPVHLATVRGSATRGVAPYVSLYGARYSSEVLQRSPGLVGQRIRVYLRPDDMREAWADAATGAELGRLVVQEGWRYSRHTLRLRKHILRERRLGRLRFAGEQDPVQLFALAQRRTGRHKLKDGTVTLQLGEVTGPAPAQPARGAHRPPPLASPSVDLSELSVQNF